MIGCYVAYLLKYLCLHERISTLLSVFERDVVIVFVNLYITPTSPPVTNTEVSVVLLAAEDRVREGLISQSLVSISSPLKSQLLQSTP